MSKCDVCVGRGVDYMSEWYACGWGGRGRELEIDEWERVNVNL